MDKPRPYMPVEYAPDKKRYHDQFKFRLDEGSPEVVIHQGPNSIGSTVWDGACVSSGFLSKEYGREMAQGAKVLELGAGTGMAGLLLGTLGADVTLTDLPKERDPATWDILVKNAAENKAICKITPKVAPLDWTSHPFSKSGSIKDKKSLSAAQVAGLPTTPVDFILGADCMYVREAVPGLVKLCQAYMTPTSVAVFVQGRNGQAMEMFTAAMIEAGFVMTTVPAERQHPKYQRPDVVSVLEFRLRQQSATLGESSAQTQPHE